MKLHAEPHKRRDGTTVLKRDLTFLGLKTYKQTWKLLNCVTGSKKPLYRKPKYNPKVYSNMLFFRSAAGAPTYITEKCTNIEYN